MCILLEGFPVKSFGRSAFVVALIVSFALPFTGGVLSGRVSAKEVYEWTDHDGTYHVTDEFSKVPSEYRSSATVRGARALPTTEAELLAQNPGIAAMPGNKIVTLEPVKSAFELPIPFSTDKGTFNDKEEFKLLGHSTGNQGQLYYSNQSVDLEVIEYGNEKASSRLGCLLAAFKLIGAYLDEHPGETADRMVLARSAVIIPSGHMVVAFNSVSPSTKLPVHVQIIMGPNGTARLRWTGPLEEFGPLAQETLVSWRNTVGGKSVLPAVSMDDLNNTWVMGAVVVVLVILASLVTGVIILIKKRND